MNNLYIGFEVVIGYFLFNYMVIELTPQNKPLYQLFLKENYSFITMLNISGYYSFKSNSY